MVGFIPTWNLVPFLAILTTALRVGSTIKDMCSPKTYIHLVRKSMVGDNLINEEKKIYSD